MSTQDQETDTSVVSKLAKRIKRDIHKRGLSAGDRYLTGPEVGHMLGVSTATANRAMSLLAEQKLLVRRRSSGTFIGSRMAPTEATRIRLVYVLAPEFQSDDIPSADLMMQGIRASIPGVNVLFGFLPTANRLTYVKDLLREPLRLGQLIGVVPMSCGRDIYQYLLDAGIPTVVSGAVYESMDRLASIDVDNYAMARLLVGHLFRKGHRRIAIIDNSQGCPGDNHFFDGVLEATSEAHRPPNAVMQRFLPDISSLFAEIGTMLSLDNPPTGFVARSLRLANAVERAIEECGVPMKRSEVVFQHHHTTNAEQSKFTHARPKEDFKQMAVQMGKILRRLGEDPTWQPEHIVLPVELCIR